MGTARPSKRAKKPGDSPKKAKPQVLLWGVDLFVLNLWQAPRDLVNPSMRPRAAKGRTLAYKNLPK